MMNFCQVILEIM